MSPHVRELAPDPRLRPVIEAIYLAGSAHRSHHAILPDGCVDLIYRCDRSCGAVTGGMLMIAGPDRRARVEAFGPELGYVGARFRPGQARRIVGLDPADLVDRGLVPAAATARLAAIERRLARCRSPGALAARLGAEIERLAGETEALAPPARVRAAIALLKTDAPRVGAVAATLGVTTRTLHRELVSWTGLRPGLLARIFRFQRARQALTGRAGTLAHVAAAMGYADQAHMTREFQALAGRAPTAFG